MFKSELVVLLQALLTIINSPHTKFDFTGSNKFVKITPAATTGALYPAITRQYYYDGINW